jgi:hypothetical protein
MYQAYWGLASSPFRGHLDPRAFHQGPTQEEALARLHFLVDEQRTVGLLLGEAGSGKSLLLEVFAQQLGAARRERAVVSLLGTSRPGNSASRGCTARRTCSCTAPSTTTSWQTATSRFRPFCCSTTPMRPPATCSTKWSVWHSSTRHNKPA